MKFDIKYSIYVLLFSAPLLISGCRSASISNNSAKQSTSTTAGIIEYLKKIPAIESVDCWPSDYGQGLLITTAHYEIYTTLREPLMLRRLPVFVEAAYDGYQKQLPRPIATNSKFIIYLFATRAEWENFTKNFAPNLAHIYLKIKTGAYYLNGACVVYNVGMNKTFSVVGHEGWHQFNNRHFRYRLPSWLDEGIATMFEENSYIDGTYKFSPAKNLNRLGSLKMTAANGRMLPVEQLIALNPGEVLDESNEAAAAFYAQSYALVRFLCEDNYGWRLGRFQQMLLGAVNGTWPIDPAAKTVAANRNIDLTVPWNRYVAETIFKTYISSDTAAINKQYLEFCGKILYYVRVKN